MGPTNEVLRQFVGKAVLLGFDALDYWNQTYNRRVVENEVKKLDPAGKRELAEQLHRAGREGRGRRSPADGRDAEPPMLLTPGLKPADPAFESWWVRPGGATRVRGAAGRPPDGDRPRRRPAGRADGARADDRARRSGVAARTRRATVLARAAELRRPSDARAIRLFGPDGPPGARQEFVARSEATVRRRRARRARRRRRLAGLGARGRAPARGAAAARGGRAAAAAGRAAARLPRRQGLARSPTRSARASTSRSSTSPGASARTSSPSTRTSSTPGSSAGSTRRSRAR